MHSKPETRLSLIMRLNSGTDGDAWTEFSNIHRPVIIRLATSKGLQPADSEGSVYSSVGAGSAGGFASGSSSGSGFGPAGVPQGYGKNNQSSQSFGFGSLPEGRSIKTIRIKMTDRTGEPKSYSFTMKKIPVPFPK